MASSTTIPIASTNPKSVRLFSVKPMAAMTAKVPMIATGTATNGIIADRQFCRNTITTMATRMIASIRVRTTSLIDSVINGVISREIV